MAYQLYYWPTIQGRGEFVRLALEEAQAEYVDVARQKNGSRALMKMLEAASAPSFAPPFLVAGEQTIGQTANILLYLGSAAWPGAARAGGAPVGQPAAADDRRPGGRGARHPPPGLQSSLYYEDQKKEAKRRAADFIASRVPKFYRLFREGAGAGGAAAAISWARA